MNHTNNSTALQSQKWILQALLDLMQTTDYDKISVSEICRKADLDRRTFYRNYDSKNDVLEQYIKTLCSAYMAQFDKINPFDNYAATLLFFEFWKQHVPFIINMQRCGLSYYVFTQFEKFVRSHQELLINHDRENPGIDYVLSYRIGGFWNVMLTWTADNATTPPAELAAILSQAQ